MSSLYYFLLCELILFTRSNNLIYLLKEKLNFHFHYIILLRFLLSFSKLAYDDINYSFILKSENRWYDLLDRLKKNN